LQNNTLLDIRQWKRIIKKEGTRNKTRAAKKKRIKTKQNENSQKKSNENGQKIEPTKMTRNTRQSMVAATTANQNDIGFQKRKRRGAEGRQK
jgi:hypothetical protein